MRVVLAGAQTDHDQRHLTELGAPSVLMSYYYLRKQSDEGRSAIRRANEAGQWVLIDSGAFTFKVKYRIHRIDQWEADGTRKERFGERWQAKALEDAKGVSRDEALAEMRAYQSEYLDWLVRHANMFDAYAELDVDTLVGDEVWEWRDKIDERVPRDRASVIITPHYKPRWSDVFERWDYIGISAQTNDVGRMKLHRFFSEHMPALKRNKVRVHGWAMTNYSAIVELPFYSVDSTSWLMGGKFGTTYEYVGNCKMRMFDTYRKDRRQNMQAACEAAGVDFTKFLDDQRTAVNRFNCYQWIQYAKEMDAYTINSYWLTEDQKKEIVAQAREKFGANMPQRHQAVMVPVSQLPVMFSSRQCNGCYLNQKCPFYEPDAPCKIAGMPEIETDADLKRLAHHMVGVQAERAMFGAFAEKVNGTPLDDRVSKEMDRALRLAKVADSMGGFEMTATTRVKASGSAAPSILEKMFGPKAEKADKPKPAEDDTIDGEVVDG